MAFIAPVHRCAIDLRELKALMECDNAGEKCVEGNKPVVALLARLTG
jgi:hypothetical protein